MPWSQPTSGRVALTPPDAGGKVASLSVRSSVPVFQQASCLVGFSVGHLVELVEEVAVDDGSELGTKFDNIELLLLPPLYCGVAEGLGKMLQGVHDRGPVQCGGIRFNGIVGGLGGEELQCLGQESGLGIETIEVKLVPVAGVWGRLQPP